MKDTEKKSEIDLNTIKLNWEPPILISLDKGKTEGGTGIGSEDWTTYPGS
ncbi:hypothetical protein ACFLS4_01925 [Bacteroidota bacterium]